MELLAGPRALGHLLRRAGFGPTPATWESFAKLPYGEAVDRVVADLRRKFIGWLQRRADIRRMKAA